MSQFFQTTDKTREHTRANIARDLAAVYAELAAPKPIEKFSLARMIRAMAKEEFKSGSSYEAGVVQAAAISQGGAFDCQRATVPWGVFAAFQRDMGTTVPSAGGNLAGGRTLGVVDVLRPHSLVARLGIKTTENNMQVLDIPKINARTTGQWLATETSEITTSDPVIGLVSSKPKTAGALMKLSRQLVMQGQNIDEVITQQLLGCMGEMLDMAVLGGTGLLGQPTGIVNAAGVDKYVLAQVADLAGALAYVGPLLEGKGVQEENIKIISTPSGKGLIQLKNFSYEFPLWKDGKVFDIPAFSTNRCPANAFIAGDFSQVRVDFWGAGIDIQIDPYTNFKTGQIQVRVLMHVDVNVLQADAFRVIYTN